MSLVSVNLTLILNYQVHCGLIALRRLMLNMPPAGQLCRLWHQCQIVAIVSTIIITYVCLFICFSILVVNCMYVCVKLSFLR